jgi:hypothetical protein
MVVINLHRNLPRDVYPTVWERVEGLVGDARAFAVRQVLEELERIDDGCGPWAKGLDGFVVDPNEDEVALVETITAAHPDWVQATTNEADPWVIAQASVHGRIIVSDENRKGPGTIGANLKIPNVADEHGVECVNFNDLARREDWQF